jgi:hypothetical protein
VLFRSVRRGTFVGVETDSSGRNGGASFHLFTITAMELSSA